MSAFLGIEKGKPFIPDDRLKKILIDAAAVGDATARTLTYQSRMKEAHIYPNSAWITPFIGGSYKFEQNGVLNLDAKADDRENGRERLPQYAGAFVVAKG